MFTCMCRVLMMLNVMAAFLQRSSLFRKEDITEKPRVIAPQNRMHRLHAEVTNSLKICTNSGWHLCCSTARSIPKIFFTLILPIA